MSISPDTSTIIKLSGFQAKLLKQQDFWLAAHGISFKEFLVMFHLDTSASKNLKRIDLADKVGLTASGVTRILNPMQKIGLVSKEEGARDARVSLVRLTEAGAALFRDAEKSFNQRSKAFMKTLDDNQRAALAELAEVRI